MHLRALIPGACLIVAVTSALVAGDSPRTIAADARKHLVLDSRVIRETQNARLELGTVTKESGNPLFRADQPWENSLNNLYPNVLWDADERVFKLWYKCVLADADAIARMDRPSTVHNVGWYLLYATSTDGLSWNRPALGQHAFAGSTATNIVARDTPNVGVFKDAHDLDAARRYKMIYDVGLGKVRVRFSPDGVHWAEPIEATGFGAYNGDTHNNAFWDERLKKYVLFTKLYLGERLAARFESDDFIAWMPSGMVLRSSVDEGRTTQTYCLPVFRYGSIYLGYAMMYHYGSSRAVDCELAWSADSLTWQRVSPGTPFIPRGVAGSYDSQCIYAMAGAPLAQGDELLIYYGGSDVKHSGWKRHCLPCLARLPLDHFAAYAPIARDQPAVLTSGVFIIGTDPVRLTADAAGGRVQVSLQGDADEVLAVSEALTTNVVDQPLRWTTGDPGALAGKRARLRLVLTNAKVYALSGVDLADAALPPAGNPLRSATYQPAPVTTATIAFAASAQGWTGVERIAHHADGGASDGYITVSRSGNQPFAQSPAKESPLAGDWPKKFGGTAATITAQVRAAQAGGTVQIELFARDLAPWRFVTSTPLGTTWTRITAPLRYDWSDAEAKAAGWQPGANAFSWHDTITHVGSLVFIPTVGSTSELLDLDDVTVTGR